MRKATIAGVIAAKPEIDELGKSPSIQKYLHPDLTVATFQVSVKRSVWQKGEPDRKNFWGVAVDENAGFAMYNFDTGTPVKITGEMKIKTYIDCHGQAVCMPDPDAKYGPAYMMEIVIEEQEIISPAELAEIEEQGKQVTIKNYY